MFPERCDGPRLGPALLAGLIAFVLASVEALAQTPPRTLDAIQRVASSHGPLRVWTYAEANVAERTGTSRYGGNYHGISHPFSTWTVGSHSVVGNVETWSGCTVPGRPGTFDVRRISAPIDPYLELVRYEIRPNFDAGAGIAVHRLRWVERIDPTMAGIGDGEIRVMLPATGCIYVRDAVQNLTRAKADTELGNEFGLRPYFPDRTDPSAGFYHNRLNIADVLSIHAFDTNGDPAWGLGVYAFDPENSDTGNLLVASNPDTSGRSSIEFGYDVVFPNDHLENNAAPGSWIPMAAMLLRSLPCVTPKEYAWWENVEFVKSQLLLPLQWVGQPSPIHSSPAWSRTAVLGVGYAVGDVAQARFEATRIRSFFQKYDAHRYQLQDYHYVPAVTHWTDELYFAPPTAAFSELMRRVGRYPPGVRSRTHILTYLSTSFYTSTRPNHPLEITRAFNDQYQPYAGFGVNWYVDPSHPAFVAAYDQAINDLRGEGVEGVYFDNPFGDLRRNYNQHKGADPANHLDQITLMDRVRNVHAWDALLIGEQSRLGSRYAAGAFLPCGFRAVPGGSGIPFIDALIHEHRLTFGAGDMLEQWFSHVKFGVRGVSTPTKRDVQNILHDYVFGFVKGQLVIDGRTEYEVDPGGVEPTIEIQIFEADPALHPSWADPDEVLGFEVLKDVADHLYPRMMWWRAKTPALQAGRMLQPPYPSARVGGAPADEWFLLQKEYYFNLPGFSVPAGSTSDYETERYPVSFWAMPGDPETLTMFMGNPTYDPVDLTFDFDVGDYPAEMGSGVWDVTVDVKPDDDPNVVPVLALEGLTTFDFSVRVAPLSFARVTFERR